MNKKHLKYLRTHNEEICICKNSSYVVGRSVISETMQQIILESC